MLKIRQKYNYVKTTLKTNSIKKFTMIFRTMILKRGLE